MQLILTETSPNRDQKKQETKTSRTTILYWISIAFFILMQSGCTMLGPDHTIPEVEIPKEWSDQKSELFKYPSSDEQAH